MMKRLFSISVLLMFAYIQFYNAGVFYSYEINKSEIIQQFCENKDKPAMKCEGKCHMKDMMIEATDEEQASPEVILPDIVLFPGVIAEDMCTCRYQTTYETAYTEDYTYEYLNDWDIPPRS